MVKGDNKTCTYRVVIVKKIFHEKSNQAFH